MPNHKSHGHEYIQPERHDELSDGVRADDKLAVRSGGPHREKGRWTSQDSGAAEAGAEGGRRRRGTTKLSHGKVSVSALSPDSCRRANTLRRTLSAEIASSVGGGYCGVAASLMVRWAAMKTAAAEEAFARGDSEAFRKLSESARMDLLYAREHAAKEAEARAKVAGPVDPLAKWYRPEDEVE